MIDFNFVAPTKIYFGKGKESLVGEAAKDHGFHRTLIIYGSDRIKKTGLLEFVTSKLKENGIEFAELSGVRANPTAEKAREGLRLAREFKADSILAIGGGSIIDTAKSIANGFYYDGDQFDFNLKKAVPTKALPIGVILTHASAGSEMSDSCVIQDDALGIKQGFNNDTSRPVFAIEDPELTYSVSPYQTAAGVSDIMMHSLERYFGHSDGDELADDWALDLIKSTMEWGKVAVKEPNNYQARAVVMLNSSLSHNGLTALGKKAPFVVHPLEHALSGYAPNITHGAGVALIYPAWALYVVDKATDKFARLTERVFKLHGANEKETAIIGIHAMKDFFASIGMPTTFEEVGLSEKDIPALVKLASGNGTRVIGGCPQSLNQADMEKIFRSLLAKEA
ncbi:MAG: iron-containing alcohol dehydrogenase [Bacilli bacterium]|nr:iron-containing alcohol dehydrogenase [Bacilli bacterium]